MREQWPWPENLLRRLRLDGTCVVYTGTLQSNGYGQVRRNGRKMLAHRAMWELMIGPIPDGLTIDHVRERGCRFRACVNVGHMELVTNAENVRRGDGWAGVNARRIECVNGHPFDEANTYRPPTGGRECRRCRAESSARYRRKIAGEQSPV